MAVGSEGLQVTRQLCLIMMSSVYLFAFSSLYTQIPGLYGPNGLAPVHNKVPTPPQKEGEWCAAGLYSMRSLMALYPCFNLSPSAVMELLCVVGVVLSMLIIAFRFMRNSVCFMALWVLYFSVFKVGQVFLWFQWDTLLLEAGLLTVILAPVIPVMPWKRHSTGGYSDGMTLWLVRWLLFRLMFASGIVKLTSQCPTWWGLTALNYHYETQCIPSPMAWYAHQLPPWFQKLSVVSTYLIEIAAPFLFFLPVRSLRLLGCFSQVLLQILIIATGNYNFFNILTITLCVSLLDDHFLGYGCKTKGSTSVYFSKVIRGVFCQCGKLLERAVKTMAFLSVTGGLLALTVYYFEMSVNWKNKKILSSIGFNKVEFDYVLRVSVPVCVVMGALSLAIEILSAALQVLSSTGLSQKFQGFVEVLGFGLICSIMFTMSVPSIGELDGQFKASIPAKINSLHDYVSEYSVTSSYGLFRRMTGVGGRPEIIIEGTNEKDLDTAVWKEYNFLYKPGSLNSPPTYVAPHQLRLDWQMWFAALGHYKNNPWLVHLVYKLLVGDKDVLRLMAPPPFTKPPKHIRARLYHYHFTRLEANDSLLTPGPWWQRDFKGDYLYVLSRDNAQLLDFLKSQNYFTKPSIQGSKSLLNTILSQLRSVANGLSPPVVLWSLFFTALSMLLTMSCMCSGGSTRRPTANVQNYLDNLAPEESVQDKEKKTHWKRSESKSAKGKRS